MITEHEVADALFTADLELNGWEDLAQQCHAASLALVRSGLLPAGARVARGACFGVGGQHSWVSIGDPYDPDTLIVDITLWSYLSDFPKVWIGPSAEGGHRPHGLGLIWDWGVPTAGDGEPVPLTPTEPLSRRARDFLELVARANYRTDGTLDFKGWHSIAHAPVQGWPAGEIFAAMADTPGLGALIPIDILGMTTDRNPDDLYW